jgi:hypothetical protein
MWNEGIVEAHAISHEMGTIPSKGPWSTSWRSIGSIPLLAGHITISRRSFCMHEILRIPTTQHTKDELLLHKHLVERRSHSLRLRVCSTFTTAASGHTVILIPFTTVDLKTVLVSAFCWNRRGHCRGPLPSTWQAYWSTILRFPGNFYRWCLKMCL